MNALLERPPVRGFGALPPPARSGREEGGGGSGWVELLRARNDIEAHLLSGRLTAAQIEVQVVKDRSAPGAWLYGGSNPWAPAILLVRRMALSDARLVLAEISFEGPAASPRASVAQGRDWRTPVVWWSLALGIGALMTGLALTRTAAVMDRCDLPLLCGDAVTSR